MATHANSTTASARPPLAHAERLDRLLPRVPLCPVAEFLLLMDLKRRTEERLDELVAIIDPEVPHLPVSGLRGMAPHVLLFKGGRHAS